MPLFITDAIPFIGRTGQKVPHYLTRFPTDYIETLAQLLPFDISKEYNHTFLFSVLNDKINFKASFNIHKWYLKLVAEKRKGKYVRKSDGAIQYFLKITPRYPYDYSLNDKDRNYGKDKLLVVPFWIIEINYDLNKDIFTAIPRDSRNGEFDETDYDYDFD